MEHLEQLQKANFTEYYEVLEKKIDEFGMPVTPPQFLAAAIGGLLVVLFLLSVIFRGKKSGNSFLFVGLCGSGKTALMCLLKNGRVVETVTTMKENDVTCKLPSSGRQVHVVDFPGHQRLRSQLDTFLPITKGIVYLVDSVESRSQLTQNAQFLFDLFTNKTVNRRRTPILIACNKSEMVTAKRKEFIQGELEKELNHLRESSARGTLADIDGKKGGNVEEITLGAVDEPFKMDQLPFKVSFAECSVKQGEVSAIEAFLSK